MLLRRILAVAAGVVVFIAIVSICDGVANALFQSPPSVDPSNPDALRDQMANVPLGALVTVLAGSTLGALAGTYITGILIGDGATYWPFVTGVIGLAATVMNALTLPHPSWFVLAAPAGVIGASVLGWWLSGRRTRPIRKIAPSPQRPAA